MKFSFTIILSLFVTILFAQKRQNIYYLKDSGKFVDLRDSADYIRVINEPDPELYFITLQNITLTVAEN